MKQENAQRWVVTLVLNRWTGKSRWGVRLIGGGGVTHIPQSYGYRAAVRLRNRLEKETQKALLMEGMKRNKASA